MESTWETRDLAVLDLIVRHFDDPNALRLDISAIVSKSNLGQDDAERALRALDSASPPLIKGRSAAGVSYPIVLFGVTERARRLVGAWPSPDALTDRLIAALQSAAEAEPDEKKRTALKRLSSLIGGMSRDVFVNVVSNVIGHAIGAS